jgi:hypothetical protein
MASQAREQSGKGGSSRDVLTIKVTLGDGEERTVVCDPNTMTLMERRHVKVELGKLGYEPDETDMLAAAIWIAMRRDDASVTFDEVCESITFEQLTDPDLVAPDQQDAADPS